MRTSALLAVVASLVCGAAADSPVDEARAAALRATNRLIALDEQSQLWSILLCGGDASSREAARAEASQIRRDARQSRDLWRAVGEPMLPKLRSERTRALRNELPVLEAIGGALEDLLMAAPDPDALRGASQLLAKARPHAPQDWVSLVDSVNTLVVCDRFDLPSATESLALLAAAPSRYRLIARLAIARLASRSGQAERAGALIDAIIAEQVSTSVPMTERILTADLADAVRVRSAPGEASGRWLALLQQSSGSERSLVRRALPSRITRLSSLGAGVPESMAAACRAAEKDCADAAELAVLARSTEQDAAAIAAWRLAECAPIPERRQILASPPADALESFCQRFPTDPDAASLARSLVALRQAQGDSGPLAVAFDVLAECTEDSLVAATARANAATVRIEMALRGSPWSSSAAVLRSLAEQASSPTAGPDQLALTAAARLRAAIANNEAHLCDLAATVQSLKPNASPQVQALLDQSVQLALALCGHCPHITASTTGDWPPGVATALAELALESFCSGTPPTWIARTSRTAPDELLSCAILAQIRGDYSTAEPLYRKALILEAEPAVAQAGLAECLIHRGGEVALIEAVSLARGAIERCTVGSPGWWRGNLAELEAIVAAGRNSPQVAAKLARLRETHGLPECPALAARFAHLASP